MVDDDLGDCTTQYTGDYLNQVIPSFGHNPYNPCISQAWEISSTNQAMKRPWKSLHENVVARSSCSLKTGRSARNTGESPNLQPGSETGASVIR